MSEIAPVIGSLAQFDVTYLVQAGVLGPLFDALSTPEQRVIESCARAIRAIVQHPIRFTSINVQFFNDRLPISTICSHYPGHLQKSR